MFVDYSSNKNRKNVQHQVWLKAENKGNTPLSHREGSVFVSLDWWFGQIKEVLIKVVNWLISVSILSQVVKIRMKDRLLSPMLGPNMPNYLWCNINDFFY